MSPKAVEYLRQRLSKPPDGRHDPRVVFGSGLTMERIQSAIYSADWGNPRAMTDLSRETLALDPHLSAVLTKRIGAIASLPLEVLPAEGPGIDKDRAGFYADVVRTQIQRIPNMKQAIRQLAWGLFDGRAVLEKIWAVTPGGTTTPFGRVTKVVTMLSWIHPRRIFFGPDRELRVVDRPIGIGFTRDGEAFRDWPHKFIEFTPQLFAEYPEREGLSRPSLYWAFFKRFSAREQMVLVELFAKPWRWGEVPEDADLSPDEIADLDDVIEQIAGNGYARLPRGAKLHVEQVAQNVSSASGGTVHKSVIELADNQISKLILGQTGTTDAKSQGLGGSQSEVMQDEQKQICLSDAAMIEEVLEDYLGDDIIQVNFGAAAVTHAPRIKLRADTVDRAKELARLKSALDCGIQVALEEAYEVSGYRMPNDDEAVLRIDVPPGGSTGPDGSTTKPAARAIIAYPVGKAPAPREQETTAETSGSLPSVPETETNPGDAGTSPMLPGPIGEDSPIVRAPEEEDPAQAGEATGNEPAATEEDISEQRGGVARPEDMTDLSSPSYGYGGVGGYASPEDADRVSRGILEKVAAGKVVTAVGDVIQKPEGEPSIGFPEPGPTPEPGRSPVPPDVQPVSMVPAAEKKDPPDITLPLGPWATFDDCVDAQKKKGKSDESAHKICGAIQQKIEGMLPRARTLAGEKFPEAGLRRILSSLGPEEAIAVLEGIGFAREREARAVSLSKKMLEKQPSTVFGSPETVVSRATRNMALRTREWATRLVDAAKGQDTAAGIFMALHKAAGRLEHDEFARDLRRRIVHAAMLGALDHAYERETDETIAPAKFDRKAWQKEILTLAPDPGFAVKAKPTFSELAYKPATDFFAKKKILPKDQFDKLEVGAKSRAFTVARMESEEMLKMVHAELGRQIAQGADLKGFAKFMKDKIESAGWTPASPSHVETIARTNLMGAYNAGRAADMTQPAQLVDRPYWQVRGVRDSRQRQNHRDADGVTMLASDPFWKRAFPPWGFNCRCRPVSLSEKQVKARGLEVKRGSDVTDLPDEGFDGAGVGDLLKQFGM